MTRTISGLSADEQALLTALDERIKTKGRRNTIRRALMDGKRTAIRMPLTASPNARTLGAVISWPAMAVDHLARRAVVTGVASPGADLDALGLTQIIEDNEYLDEVPLGESDSLVYGTSFEVVTKGIPGEGEPDAVISQVSALTATGTLNPRTRRLDAFLSVISRTDSGEIDSANLYLPRLTIQIKGGEVAYRQVHSLGVPAEVVPFLPRTDRRFGRSRISREVMYLASAAVRSMLRSEDTADLYGTPALIVLGADSDVFEKGDWSALVDRINGVPDDEDAQNPRASIQQIAQAVQTPHMEHLQTLAGHFAGATGIPVSSLGVGLAQANPTSSESFVAGREDLISLAEQASKVWGARHARTLRTAWQVGYGMTEVPDEIRGLRMTYRDPRFTSQAAQSDATTKLVAAFPWMAESDAIVESLGFDRITTDRLLAEKRAAQGRATVQAMLARSAPAPATPDPGTSEQVSDEAEVATDA